MRVIGRVIRLLFAGVLISICRGSMNSTEETETEGSDRNCSSPTVQSMIVWNPTAEQIENGLRNGKMAFVKNLNSPCNDKIPFKSVLVPDTLLNLDSCSFLKYLVENNPLVEDKSTFTVAINFTEKKGKNKNKNKYILGKDKKKLEKILPETEKYLNSILGVVAYELYKRKISERKNIFHIFMNHTENNDEPSIKTVLSTGIREEIKKYIKQSRRISKKEIKEIIRRENEKINYEQFLSAVEWIYKINYAIKHTKLYEEMKKLISKISSIFAKHRYNSAVLEILKKNKENIRSILDEFYPEREKDFDTDENIFMRSNYGIKILENIFKDKENLGNLKIKLTDRDKNELMNMAVIYRNIRLITDIDSARIDWPILNGIIKLISLIRKTEEYFSTLTEVDEVWKNTLYGSCISSETDPSENILIIQIMKKETESSVIRIVEMNRENIETIIKEKEEDSILKLVEQLEEYFTEKSEVARRYSQNIKCMEEIKELFTSATKLVYLTELFQNNSKQK